MYREYGIAKVYFFIFLMSGCANTTDRKLSPPSDTQWVNVEVKNPLSYTRPFPLEVLYTSNKCKRELMSMRDGKRYEKVGYNTIKIPLQQQGASNIWLAKLAINGGGSCDWMLSEFTLGIEYTDAKKFGNDLVPGSAVGATFVFGDTMSSRHFFKLFDSDITLKPKYYPYIKRYSRIKGGAEKDMISLFGDNTDFPDYHVNLKRQEGINVVYSPVVNEYKIAEIIFPYQKGKGEHTKIVYPDGSFTADGRIYPDFKKMEGIK